jgi:hypothetical protein
MHRRAIAMALLIGAGSTHIELAAGQAPAANSTVPRVEEPAGGFRQFPGGKVVANLRAGLPSRAAAAALRADADRELPEGIRLRDDGEPVVAPLGRKRLFKFGLAYRGIRLSAASTYVAIVGENGKVLSSRFQHVPDAVDATAPTVLASAAVAAATGHARQTRGQSGALSGTTPELEVWVDAQRQGRLCWSMTVHETRDGTIRSATQYHVAAVESPMVVSWADTIHYDTVHVQTNVWDLSPQAPVLTAPLANARVFLNGVSTLTDDQGNVVLPANPPGSAQVVLTGPFADVTSAAGPRFTGSVATAGGDETLHVAAATEFTLAQTTAFTWTTSGNRWAREFLPFLNTSPTVLDGLDVVVNEIRPCNAASTGRSIHFGRATSSCNNMATPTIVLHEFGHALHAAISGGALDLAFSEGFGDAVAALITEQPCQGPGMVLGSPAACLRDATAVTLWPVASEDVHAIGQPFAQFAWALATDIGFHAATEIVLGTAMAGPVDVPDAIRLSFVADDDDGLLGTCSPHQPALQAAADSRRLPRPPDCRATGDNQSPTARDDAFSFAEDDGGRAIDLVGNDTDPDGDQLIVSIVQPGQLGTLDCSPMPCRYTPRRDANGSESLTYTAVDTFGGEATATVHILIAPVDDLLAVVGRGDVQGVEDVPAPVLVSVVDPDGPAFSMRWFVGGDGSPAPCTFADPLSAATTLTCTHEGAFPFGVVVTQGGSERAETLGIAEIANTRPSVVITAPAAGASFAASATVSVAARFDDGPTPGLHTCEITWGDGTAAAGAADVGTCTGSHVYTAASTGTRQITVVVLDAGLARGAASVPIVITSAGAATCVRQPGQTCTVLGLGIVGRQPAVAFEFTAGVRNAQPIGQMLLLEGSWRFLSTAIRSLSIVGDRATFAGMGSLSGRTGYAFEATVTDNRRLLGRSGTPDRLRVVIRDPGGTVVRVVEGDVTRGDVVVD